MEIDQASIEAKVVEIAADRIVESLLENYDFATRINEVLEKVGVERCDKVITPVLEQGVSEYVIRQTNQFGETKGEDVTFAEYLTNLAETFLNETVNYKGEANNRSYHKADTQSRLTFLLNGHLHYQIEEHIKDAVATVIKQIAPAIATTCELKVKEATDSIRRAMNRD